MARSLQDVLSEVTAQSDPQRQTILRQVADLPNQQLAEETALGARKDQAFDDILSGARRRGLGFSGIPLGEQAKYTATEYAPAVANLKTSYNTRKGTLESALADIGRNDYNTAYGIYDRERTFDEQQRQFNEQQRAAAAQNNAFAGLFNTPNNQQPAPTAPAAAIQQRADKGFNFTDANGRAISAAQFAAVKGIPFRQLLQEMATAGDAGAKQALGFVGDDFKYDPRKLNSPAVAQLYNDLVWGTGLSANYTPPQQNKVQQAASQVKSSNAPTLGNALRINSFFGGR